MTTISFKVSQEESRAIRARARREHLSLSAFLRRQAVAHPRAAAKINLRQCPLTGATIFDGAEGLPPLTVETTREMLADFP